MKPKDVNIYNQHIVLDTLCGKYWATPKLSNIKFKVGNDVRISKMKHVFAKGYAGNWSYKMFTIVKVIPRNPAVYKIKHYDGNEMKDYFIQKNFKKLRKVKTVIGKLKCVKNKMQNGKTEYFVKWMHHPKSMV